MKMTSSLRTAVGSVLGAAVLGNAWVGKDDLAWLNSVDRPRMQIPLPAFAAVGAIYYVILGVVIYRACDRHDKRSTRLALTVLVLNEVWNVFFFRFRSARNGFAGILLFLLPLGALQRAVASDVTSAVVLAPYTAWVVGYDLPWTLALWRLNTRARTSAAVLTRG
jgi:tryptophan-rich sensory protein